MIFVTVGTHHQPFDRLVSAVAALPVAEVVVQHGHSSRPEGVLEAVDFMTVPDLLARMQAAQVVVTHGGVGSVLLAIRSGHTPIVVPRLRRFGEHVDDHQSELTRAMEHEGKVVGVWEIDDLGQAVATPPARTPAPATSEGPLHSAVRAALGGVRPLPRRPGASPGIL